MSKIFIATSNNNKIIEFRSLLEPLGYSVLSLQDVSCNIDVIENCKTFEANSYKKAKEYSEFFNSTVIAEDSGIEVMALNNEPGVYSARYSGHPRSDIANNKLLMKNMSGILDRKCKYVSVITLYKKNGTHKTFRGELHGNIALSESNIQGFGYDSLFELPDGRIISEIDKVEKNKISHRFKATSKLLKNLKEVNYE